MSGAEFSSHEVGTGVLEIDANTASQPAPQAVPSSQGVTDVSFSLGLNAVEQPAPKPVVGQSFSVSSQPPVVTASPGNSSPSPRNTSPSASMASNEKSITPNVHPTVQKQNYFVRFGNQMGALTYKNALLAVRNWRSFVLRLAAPPFFLFLVWVINKLVMAGYNLYDQFDTVRNPPPDYVPGIPACTTVPFMKKGCYDFLYTPANDSTVNAIIAGIMNNNPGHQIPSSRVMSFPDRLSTNTWLMNNPLLVLGAYHFDISSPTNIGFTLQTNSTVQYFRSVFSNPTFDIQVPMQVAAEREISRYYLQQAGNQDAQGLLWDVAYKLFAHPPYNSFSIVSGIAGPFIFAACMFGFVSLLGLLVLEKEAGLRQALRTMGMLDSAYWMSWMLYETVIGIWVALSICAMGAICAFPMFRKNSFALYFGLFFSFSLAMTSLSLALSVLIKKSASAVYLGFALFIVGWIVQVAVNFGYPFTPGNLHSVYFLTVIFALMPWALLAKGLTDLGNAVAEPSYPGLGITDGSSYCKNVPALKSVGQVVVNGKFVDYNCVLPLTTTIGFLFAQWGMYFILAVYLDNVLPNERGVRRPLFFFLQPSYWFEVGNFFPRRADHQIVTPKGKQSVQPPIAREIGAEETVDGDVLAEEELMKGLLSSLHQGGEAALKQLDNYAVAMFGLQKVWRSFPAYQLGFSKEFWSMKGSWMGIEKGQLLCLLGPNGAGKTTTINCLTGVIPPSGGDALVYNEVLSSAGGIDRIRSMMGVCPQFDVLWGELTGEEHMRIYATMKGLRKAERAAQAADLLSRVKLTEAASQQSGTYSGGMKRRLSVAIALLGDPKIVYLDEPTTGMDPISRRHVWDIIESAKAGRAIVLTTHSMEEADILGDRIAIMARGQLRALGTSIRLKQRFGSGYQVSVSVVDEAAANTGAAALDDDAKFAQVKAFFLEHLGLESADCTGAYMTFRVPQSKEKMLPDFLSLLEREQRALGVNDIQMSLTSLEEVFLNIARQAEVEASRAGGAGNIKIYLDDGGVLDVPVGEEMAEDRVHNARYKVEWAQDENGQLQVLAYTKVPPEATPAVM